MYSNAYIHNNKKASQKMDQDRSIKQDQVNISYHYTIFLKTLISLFLHSVFKAKRIKKLTSSNISIRAL